MTSEPNIIEKNEDDCSSSKRCFETIENNEHILVVVKVTNFTNLTNTDDGAAIHLKNTGFECEKKVFTECVSFENSGAIYIKNTYDYQNRITLDHLTLNRCEAQYGGAFYIYCNFNGNIANAIETSDIFGGSAVYIVAINGMMFRNTFIIKVLVEQ